MHAVCERPNGRNSVAELCDYAGFALLSPLAVKILLTVTMLAPAGDVIKYEDIAAISGVTGRASIRKALLELEKHRLLRVWQQRDEDGKMQGIFLTPLAPPPGVPRAVIEEQLSLCDFCAREAEQRRRRLQTFPVAEEEMLREGAMTCVG